MNNEQIIEIIDNHLTNDSIKHLEKTITSYDDLQRYRNVVNMSIRKMSIEPTLHTTKPTIEDVKLYNDNLLRHQAIMTATSSKDVVQLYNYLRTVYNERLTNAHASLIANHENEIRQLIYDELHSNLDANKVYDSISKYSISNAKERINTLNNHYDELEVYLK